MSQALMEFGPMKGFEAMMREPCTWNEGVPDRSGLAQYIVAYRCEYDPEPMSRKDKHAQGAGFEAWRTDMKGNPRDWAAAIVRLLRDRQSRTFNGIVLELTGMQYTADVALGKPPEDGLWLAVERGLVWWASVGECTRFAARPAVFV
jgi:hypothetical protein